MLYRRLLGITLIVLIFIVALVPVFGANQVTIEAVSNVVGNCQSRFLVEVDITGEMVTNDRAGYDYVSAVIYDANGVVVSAGAIAKSTESTLTETIPTAIFFRRPTARPFTIRIHDIAGFGDRHAQDFVDGDVLAEYEFDLEDGHLNCREIPWLGNSLPDTLNLDETIGS